MPNTGAYVYNGDPNIHKYEDYFIADHTYTISIPAFSAGTLSTLDREQRLALAEQFFKPEYGWTTECILTPKQQAPDKIFWELTIVYSVSKGGLPIERTLREFISHIQENYGVVISTRDSMGLPAPWVWDHNAVPETIPEAPVGTSSKLSIVPLVILLLGLGANIYIKSHLLART